MFAVLCICIGTGGSEKKKWMGDISLCPVFFMLYQKRSAGRHHANLLWLPSWQMDFCRWQTIILPFDIREVARESLFDLQKKKDLWFDRIFFFSLCMVCNIMSGAERDQFVVVTPSKGTREHQMKTSGGRFKSKIKEIASSYTSLLHCRSPHSQTLWIQHIYWGHKGRRVTEGKSTRAY